MSTNRYRFSGMRKNELMNFRPVKNEDQNSLLLLLIVLFPLLILSNCQIEANRDSIINSSELPPLPPEGDFYFHDITTSSGVDFKHTIGDEHLSNLIETVGGGAAFLDFDQDGFIDLYICNGSFTKDLSEGEEPDETYTNKLYRNLGNGRYKNVTQQAKVGDTGYGMGVTVGDFNNDGYPDIYVSNHGPNTLYQNRGDGTFADVSKSSGLEGNESSVGSTWFDYDNDGFLDIYVGNYIKFDPKYNLFYAPDGFPGPMSYDAESDRLYHNLGDGKFEDVTEEMGVLNSLGRAMGVGAADYDNDGYVDIFVANDHMANYLYHNEAGQGFKDLGVMSGVAFNQVGEATISMAVDFADFNGDGLIDLFVSDDGYCSLFQNMGGGLFTELSYKAGIAIPSGQFVGWNSSFIDYDNDGDLDIFKVNGELKHLYGQEDQLFSYAGDGQYEDISLASGPYFQEERVGRGGCFGDYDNDGDLDAYIVNLDDSGVFLRNDKGSKNHWIEIKLVGTTSNRDGIGARIKIKSSGKVQTTQKKSASGYLSQNDPRIHFGLGESDVVEEIEVVWPSGKVQTLQNIKAGQVLEIIEDK